MAGTTNWKDVDLTDYPDLAESLESADVNNWDLDSDQLLDLAASLSDFFSGTNSINDVIKDIPGDNLVKMKKLLDADSNFYDNYFKENPLSNGKSSARNTAANKHVNVGNPKLHASPGSHYLPDVSLFGDKTTNVGSVASTTQDPKNDTNIPNFYSTDEIEDDFDWESILET
ncbi:hypothetical protein HELRODRAFT_192201 [Helobdella robusta]|uniref:Uncharacterized protein n=1 Tax=Helobdella robusta TaxID=6412 RepID=T1FTP4_HELRO|nr:hypothetical protein HELRODRAFT_192201 [Helobdella robusta]ESO01601.1 hypothetical protein HELRODRAFT_192201 [Helobdella robusta]